MKRMMRVLPLALAMMLATGCADKFFAAKVAVQSGRAALNMANIGLVTADKAKQDACKIPICEKVDKPGTVKYRECMGQDHSADPTWVSCYAKMRHFMKTTWPQAEKTAKAGFDTADASINLAEAQKSGLPLDVMPVVKASACFVAQALEFLPAKAKKSVQMFLDMMKAFGCSSAPAPAAVPPAPAPRPPAAPPASDSRPAPARP